MATTIESASAQSAGIKLNDLVIRLAGEGGEGVVSTGRMLGDAFVRCNLKIFTFQTFPAEIKGGTVMYQLRTNAQPIRSQGDVADCFAAFTQEGYDKYAAQMPSDSYVLFNADEVKGVSDRFTATYGVPMTALAREVGDVITKTTVGAGAIAAMLHMDLSIFEDLLRKRFASKAKKQIAEAQAKGTWQDGQEAPIIAVNLAALRVGYEYFRKLEAENNATTPFRIEPIPGEQKMIATGNRMIALGALAAGCRTYAGYPITPATDIMEELAKFMPQFGGSVMQVEDEIAALGVVVGASYAGQRAFTATSGPGVSLMIEMLGLASMLELPIVIVDAMRAGPSTGMPTKTEQGDLYMAAFAGHGDSPRIVLAPRTVTDCFWVMVEAFNLAEKYQVPVLVLTDQSLAARNESVDRPDLSLIELEPRLVPTADQLEHFARYEITETGVSPFAVPGTPGGMNFSTGVEHDEGGNIKHDPWVHREMTQKRFRKLQTAIAAGDLNSIEPYGDPAAKLGVLAWGSNYGIIQEAVDMVAAKGIVVEFLCPRTLFPVVRPELEPFLQKYDQVLVPENNFQGQYLTILRNEFPELASKLKPVHKYEGLPFTPSEIADAIMEAVQA